MKQSKRLHGHDIDILCEMRKQSDRPTDEKKVTSKYVPTTHNRVLKSARDAIVNVSKM